MAILKQPTRYSVLRYTLYTLVYNQTYIKARTHATALWILRSVWSFTTAGYTIFPTKAACSRLSVWRSLISVAITEIAATWREPHPHRGSTSTTVGVILPLLPVFRFRDEPPIITDFFLADRRWSAGRVNPTPLTVVFRFPDFWRSDLPLFFFP